MEPTSLIGSPGPTSGRREPPDPGATIPGEGESPSGQIEGCLRLLDEVWPAGDRPIGEVPAELGRFRILGELGRGGFGVVFLAEDALLGRKVALKVPRVEALPASESWRRFLREAQAASRLDHANLVPLLEAGAAGPVGYIVSTYVPGPSLDRWLAARTGPAPPRWAAGLVATLARAIDHVHGRKILHRDLKPANVLLDAPGHAIGPADAPTWADVPLEAWFPRICDFGLAKLREIEEDETRSRLVCGSPPYMAPEQAESRREEIGPETDVYGLGAILYELLTGRPPFGGGSSLEILRKVAAEEPVPPRRRRPGLPRDLETICLKCLAKRPERRYATAADLADDLDRFLDGRPVAARPTTLPERAVRWVRRHPAATTLISASVLGLVAALGGALWHASVLREKNEELSRVAIRAERHAEEAEAHRRTAEQRADLIRRQLADTQIFQAHQALAQGRYERARRLLAATATEFGSAEASTFAWSYLSEAVRDHIEVLEGHRGQVVSLAISTDGRRLASGDDRGEIRIWDVDGGHGRATISGPTGAVERLAWGRDGRMLASASRDSGEVRIWEAATGRCLGRLRGTGAGEPIWDLRFDDGGGRIRASGPRTEAGAPLVRYWDLTTSRGEFEEIPGGIGGGESVNPRLAEIAGLLETSGRPRDGSGVAITGDRAFGVVARGDDAYEVMRGGSGTMLALVRRRPGRARVLLVAPKNDRGAATTEERRRLVDLAQGLVPGWRPGASGPDRRVHAWWSGASGPESGEVVVWHEVYKRLCLIEVDGGAERRVSELGPLNGVQSMALGPDGTTLVLGTEDRRVLVWHRRPRSRVLTTPGHGSKEVWAVAFSRDGQTLASAGDDHLVRIWDAGDGRELARLKGPDSLVTSIAVSRNGGTLAAGSFDRTNPVMLWDLKDRRPVRRLEAPPERVRGVAISPDGGTVAAGGDGDAILFWDVRSGRRTGTIALGERPGPSYLAFRPDGRFLAFSGVRPGLVEVESGRYRRLEANEAVGPLAFSLDGKLLLAGMRDGAIQTWDVATGREIRRVQAHAGLLFGLALLPDGTTLASAGEEGTVRLWDAATGQELLSLIDGTVRVNAVAFSADGKRLAAADHSGAVTIWDARPRR